jgi:flagellar biosynthesis protein FlhB
LSDDAHSDDKQFEPTPYKLQQAHQDGLAARSSDLAAAAGMLLSLAVVTFAGPVLMRELQLMTGEMLGGISANAVRMPGALPMARLGMLVALVGVGAIVGGVAAAVIMGNAAFNSARLRFNWDKINPGAGLSRMVGRAAGVRAVFAACKILLVGGVMLDALVRSSVGLASLGGVSPREMALSAWTLLLWAAWKIAGGLAILAIADAIYQRWEFRQGLKMTRRELMEELKRTEGDVRFRKRRMTRVT